ncbi:hypothetical protein [Paractinoplanes atraurantiacus]|uniref:PH domain-containing protein n=1 Tax=Paractinoplanes atraurantiacus TaxID=1036182 RepID=A0A285IUK8_9ACTN|nr:hypothetical protein [Actinoplanes atraurantiacus]SNY51715.1 hypothetical protein SAMN05421748_11270 [Actinoplanes atraurantiacus]
MTTPYPVVKRIPDDQPFVVRPHLAKRLGLAGASSVFIWLFTLCLFGLAGLGEDDVNWGALVAVPVVIGILYFLLVGGIVWLVASGGPVLAAGPAGLWIKTRPTRGQAVWLPWEHIGLISRRRWFLEKMLVVHPRDPRLNDRLGSFTAVDASQLNLFFGSGLTATLTFADKKEAEILRAVAYFANQRVPLA